MEFSKKIVVWAIIYTTITTIAYCGLFYFEKEASPELIGLTGAVILGVIISYMGKAGAENIKKINKGIGDSKDDKV